jgi:hypothetical protein
MYDAPVIRLTTKTAVRTAAAVTILVNRVFLAIANTHLSFNEKYSHQKRRQHKNSRDLLPNIVTFEKIPD